MLGSVSVCGIEKGKEKLRKASADGAVGGVAQAGGKVVKKKGKCLEVLGFVSCVGEEKGQ